MLTALVLMLSVAVILAVGESVRSQCRRMLSRPVTVGQSADREPAPARATA